MTEFPCLVNYSFLFRFQAIFLIRIMFYIHIHFVLVVLKCCSHFTGSHLDSLYMNYVQQMISKRGKKCVCRLKYPWPLLPHLFFHTNRVFLDLLHDPNLAVQLHTSLIIINSTLKYFSKNHTWKTRISYKQFKCTIENDLKSAFLLPSLDLQHLVWLQLIVAFSKKQSHPRAVSSD